MNHQTIIRFWFEEISPSAWFKKDLEFDQRLRDRYLLWHQAAAAGELSHWRESAQGCLAEVLILDQFSRNMFRDQPEAFRFDPLALALSQEAIRRGLDLSDATKPLTEAQRRFLYMPFMHSESLKIHDQSIALFESLEDKETLRYEHRHRDIIERFGRYPHRNQVLGRESTPEEIAFLTQPGSGF